MTQKTICGIILIVLIAPAVIQCISVIGPRVLRPFVSYRVAIAGGARAYTLYVAVEGRKTNGEQFTQGREVQVQAASSRLIDLDIGDPGPGKYALVARSTSGPLFSSSATLVYQPRSFCVFVQTDKRVYQPGDTINFRVIVLDKYLLPLSGTVDVNILDAGGSPVQQWAGLRLDRGVLSDELLLADEPALGQWTIQVEVRGQIYSQEILVADYVMPKFQMDMQMPKEMLFVDGRFNINVTAKHFNGLPVKGELTISAYAVFFSGLLQPVVSSPARKVIEFNGQADVIFDLKTDLDLAEDAARPLVVEAVLEEKDTLIKQNVSSRILLLRTPYRLKVTAPDHFKPELPYNVQIELVDSSGKVMDTDDEVTVEKLWDDGAPVNITNIALNKGLALYTLVPDKLHASSTLNLVVKYKSVSERVVNVQRSSPSGDRYLTVEVLTRGSSVGDDLRARISSTQPMDIVNYAVIGRGDILIAKTLELSPARKSVDITIGLTQATSPGVVLLAWGPMLEPALSPVLSAAVYTPVNKLLQNTVSISSSASGSVYKPGGLVELRVSGAPGSHAGLIAGDDNAVVAGVSSDITLHKIEREVESFSGLKHSVFKNEDHLPGMGLDLGGYNTHDVFQNTGLVILTDGVIEQSYEGEHARQSLPETGTRPPLAGPYAFSRLPPPPSPRYYLSVVPQPTWMFSNFSLDYDGKGSAERTAPTTPGEFIVGAFAVHPTLGLGLASPQKFTTSVPLTITAELPANLQKGETIAVVVILKSSLTVDTDVEVTFHNTDQYFEFEPLENSVDSTKKIELYRRLHVSIPARSSASTAFLVTVVRTGDAPVIVEASGNGISASLFRTIVVQDGYEEEITSWSLIDARRGVARANITLQPPAGTRLGPVSLLAAGDLLAAALQAARAAPPPAGDPAGALAPMAVSCVLLDYLQATGQTSPAISKEARAQVAAGVQRAMARRRADGSFAQEPGADAPGDVWSTAISARWLSRCARHTDISNMAATSARSWLVSSQLQDGGWPALSGNPRATAIPRAAQAALTLIQNQGSEVLYQNAINKAIDYIAKGLSPSLDPYSLAIASNALAAAKHPLAIKALQMMDTYANVTGSTLFWSRKLPGTEWRNPWLRGNSLAANTAACALRTMLARRLIDEATPVARFLIQSYRSNEQDPDVLDALAQFAEAIRSSSKLRVSVNVTGSDEVRQFSLGEDDALVIQTQPIRNSRSALASTEGRGLALVGLSARGSTNVTSAWPRYTLDPRVDLVSTSYRLQLSICVGFVPQKNDTESGLTLLTVQLPSGYLADINTLTELTSSPHVLSARVRGGGARVLAWLRAGLAERCATLAAPRALPVARQRAGWATLADLTDSSHRARVFFYGVPSSPCDVCRAWASCARACGAAASQRAAERSPADAATARSSAAGIYASTMLVAVALLVTRYIY